MQNSNEHQQFQNGAAEKTGDTLTRRMRAGLLHSGLPAQFWGAAVIMAADVMNATPHRSLNNDTPYHRQFGHHARLDTFRPFGCRATVFQGKDLVDHRKITPRGLSGLYIGTGQSFGRKCFLVYCPGIHRVIASTDCQFDETYYPMRPPGHKRDYGVHDQQADYLLNSAADQVDSHIIDAVRYMPHDNPA